MDSASDSTAAPVAASDPSPRGSASLSASVSSSSSQPSNLLSNLPSTSTSSNIPAAAPVSSTASLTPRPPSSSPSVAVPVTLSSDRFLSSGPDSTFLTSAHLAEPPSSLPLPQPPSGPSSFSSLRQVHQLHSTLQSAIGNVQSKTSEILKGQERDLLRAFKMKFGEMEELLKSERHKNLIGSEEWRNRCSQLFSELESLKDWNIQLWNSNENLKKENRLNKEKLKLKEEDREFFIKQIGGLKKENARCRFFIEQLQKEIDSLQHQQQQVQQVEKEKQQRIMERERERERMSLGLSGEEEWKGDSTSVSASASVGSLLPSLNGSKRFSSSSHHPKATASDLQLGLINATPLNFNMHHSTSTGNQTARGRLESTQHSKHANSLSKTSSSSSFSASLSLPYPTGVSEPLTVAREQRYRYDIERLKQKVENERMKAKMAQTAYWNELEGRNQLQELFLKCMDDVKIMKSKVRKGVLDDVNNGGNGAKGITSSSGTGSTSDSTPHWSRVEYSDLTAKDRIAAVEWFMSQEEVFRLLYQALFQSKSTNTTKSSSSSAASATHTNTNTSMNSKELVPFRPDSKQSSNAVSLDQS